MNGTEAIEKAAFEKPDLILMDLNLPDISGIDAARAVKAIADTRIFQSLRKRLGVRGNGREKH
jgi:CheY-like chemotaxis protein